jgi:glutamine synthetase
MQSGSPFSNKDEIIQYISNNNIKILNLCHIPEEGRLKTLSFSISKTDRVEERVRVEEIFDFGERVDGSSLFSSIEPGNSDIYLMPRFDRAFINPFAVLPTLNVLCDYLDEKGKPLEMAPKTVMTKAEEQLFSTTGMRLNALAELEFYVMSRYAGEIPFQESADRNYHESAPFAKFENLRNEILATLDVVGIPTKYGHGEVGTTVLKNGTFLEQHEIELKLSTLSETAENIAVAKWVIRNTCLIHGVSVSFSPKITLNNAGTGMHIHLCALKGNENVIANPNGTLSADGLKMIGGILRFAPSLSAFGNPTPVSYLRFVARKETPMHVCWSARNRLALIRIPLWWSFRTNSGMSGSCRQTFEYRAPDALANVYLLFAGIALAVNFGLENTEESTKLAEGLHAEDVGGRTRGLRALPRSCVESSRNLRRDRKLYEIGGVFPKKLIDSAISRLSVYRDENLWQNLIDRPEKIEQVLKQYLHHG